MTLFGYAAKNQSMKKENNKPHTNHSKNAPFAIYNSQNPNFLSSIAFASIKIQPSRITLTATNFPSTSTMPLNNTPKNSINNPNNINIPVA
jgi:hypothetical protein